MDGMILCRGHGLGYAYACCICRCGVVECIREAGAPVTKVAGYDGKGVWAGQVGSENGAETSFGRLGDSADDDGDDEDVFVLKDFANIGQMHFDAVFCFVLGQGEEGKVLGKFIDGYLGVREMGEGGRKGRTLCVERESPNGGLVFGAL